MEDNEDFAQSEKSDRRVKTFKDAIQYAMLDARSQKMVESFAKKREVIPDVITEEYDEDKKGIERRLEDSDKTLSELLRDGTELITNIRIANDKREVDRRIKEAELREELLEKLQNESTEARNKLEAITIRWSEIESIKDPMGMYEALETQKKRIKELMDQKDEIIQECRKELDAADIRYVQDQEKQNSDIQCLVERIDNQIEVMKRAYKEHLELLQETITHERDELRKHANKKWDEMYANRESNEELKLRKEKDKREVQTKEIEDLQLEHEEITRATRIRLELDNQALEIELQKTKANVLLNSEKLDYNYQVLRKREDENILIRNQQKRRLGRLYDTIANLRKKIRDKTAASNHEIEKLTSEVVKLHAGILDLEKKASLFTETNDKKYQNVWQMNYEECLSQLDKVLQIDKTLTEQQLGMEWQEPEMDLYRLEDLPSYKNAIKTIKEEMENPTETKTITVVTRRESLTNDHTQKLLKQILKKITDKTDFLVEEKVFELLKPYTEEEKTLVCLDNVFNALGIQKVDDINSLKNYFLPYVVCQECANQEEECRETSSRLSSLIEEEEEDASTSTASHEQKLQIVKYDPDGQRFDDTTTHFDSETGDDQCDPKIQKIKQCIYNGHTILIDSTDVLEVLKEFVQVHISASDELKTTTTTIEDKSPQVKSTVSRLLSPNDVQQFWKRFDNVFSPEKEKVWQSLEYGLSQYLKVLKEREELDNECEFLRNQNAELKHLMQKFVPDADH
uniref:CSON010850 protein n=1 Tax=Culicoides sonorensis TaxID=179676 RepID=A0A336LPQ8_CULSO